MQWQKKHTHTTYQHNKNNNAASRGKILTSEKKTPTSSMKKNINHITTGMIRLLIAKTKRHCARKKNEKKTQQVLVYTRTACVLFTFPYACSGEKGPFEWSSYSCYYPNGHHKSAPTVTSHFRPNGHSTAVAVPDILVYAYVLVCQGNY